MSLESTWSDTTTFRLDVPGREGFVRQLTGQIERCEHGQDSTVFGVVGPWGSGKTSVLNAVAESIQNDWSVVHFTPWAASSVDGVAAEFIAALQSAFPPGQKAKLRSTLATYASLLTPTLQLIPYVGQTASDTAQAAMSLIADREPWYETYQSIAEEAASLERRVLVIVDDVDRLESEELRALLRVVRLVGRFKNIHYLLAYDEASVGELLKTSSGNGLRGSKFMEKIVQFPFELPTVPRLTARRWARECLEVVSNVYSDAGGAGHPDAEDLVEALAQGLRTPRGWQRLLHQINATAGAAKVAELDPLDFIAVTWLRLNAHSVWEDLRANDSSLLRKARRQESSDEDSLSGALKTVAGEHLTPPTESLVRFLLRVESFEDLLRVRRRRRFIHARYAERYFVFVIADDDVSDEMIDALVDDFNSDQVADAAREFEAILRGDDEERIALALDLVRDARSSSTAPTPALVEALRLYDSFYPVDFENPSVPRRHLDQWLMIEVLRVLRDKTLPVDEVVDWFGYQRLVLFALDSRRGRETYSELRAAYAGLTLNWVRHARVLTLAELEREPAFKLLVGWVEWAGEGKAEEGFLADHVRSVQDFLLLAEQFVGFKRWVGSGVHFEIDFRHKEFVFAIGNDTLQRWLPDVVADERERWYPIDDRDSPELDADEKAHFARSAVLTLLQRPETTQALGAE